MEKLSKPKAQVGEQHTNTCTKQQQASVVKAEQKNRKKNPVRVHRAVHGGFEGASS
jgi:hypothetical protein